MLVVQIRPVGSESRSDNITNPTVAKFRLFVAYSFGFFNGTMPIFQARPKDSKYTGVCLEKPNWCPDWASSFTVYMEQRLI